MGQDFAIISINYEMGKQLSYEDIIDDFASKKARKQTFPAEDVEAENGMNLNDHRRVRDVLSQDPDTGGGGQRRQGSRKELGSMTAEMSWRRVEAQLKSKRVHLWRALKAKPYRMIG
ncbi:hypothetical protein CRENBAI_004211 [Crenichthys baileyi]|uniref:Uncharacterized protein n=1 Tax=Crenichthys baileyi TaxID=28760 RepID=A0AAV9QUC5_9TELE